VQILDGLKFQLHKQYSAFMKHHPHFLSNGGTVSIIGHSLGSVITYDLLLHTAECKGGLDVTSSGGGETPTSTNTSANSSPSLSKSSAVMVAGSSSSRASAKGPRAVHLGNGKAGGGAGGVRFDPNVASLDPSLSLSLSGGDEEEPMMIGEDEPGEGV
jgi:hypothetical protein